MSLAARQRRYQPVAEAEEDASLPLMQGAGRPKSAYTRSSPQQQRPQQKADADAVMLEDFFLDMSEEASAGSGSAPGYSSPSGHAALAKLGVTKQAAQRPSQLAGSARLHAKQQQRGNGTAPAHAPAKPHAPAPPAMPSPAPQLQQQQQDQGAVQPEQFIFEGEGYAEVGTIRRAGDEDDDEFDYAFEGKQREGATHKQVYKPKAMPKHLVTNLKQQPLNALTEEEEEEEEEAEEEEEDEQDEGEDQQEEEEEVQHEDEAAAARRAAEQEWQAAEQAQTHRGGPATWGGATQPAVAAATAAPGASARPGALPGPGSSPPANKWGASPPTDRAPGDAHRTSPTQMPGSSRRNAAAGAGAGAGAGPVAAPVWSPERVSGSRGPAVAGAAAGQGADGFGESGSAVRTSAGSRHSGGIGSQGREQRTRMAAAHVGAGANAGAAQGAATGAGPGAGTEAEDEWEVANALLQQAAAPQAPYHRPPPLTLPTTPTPTASHAVQHSAPRAHTTTSQPALASSSAAAAGSALLPYHEALLQLMTSDLSPQRSGVVGDLPPPAGWLKQALCFGPPQLKPLLKEQQVRLLSLARLPFSESEPLHFRLLCSLFSVFTGHRPELPRLGSHWAELGFQGQDPATDLRASGMLGLLHMYLLYQHDAVNASRLYRLSRSAEQEFPLAVVSLNITKWTVQALREGKLSRAATRMGSTVEASGAFYVGTFYTFYRIWKDGLKTMRESGYVMSDLEALCKKRPEAMIQAALEVLDE